MRDEEMAKQPEERSFKKIINMDLVFQFLFSLIFGLLFYFNTHFNKDLDKRCVYLSDWTSVFSYYLFCLVAYVLLLSIRVVYHHNKGEDDKID